MNRTKIEWTDYSWNPVTGCLHGCWYCYAKKLFTRFNRSFEPMFHPERLDEPNKLRKPSKIFCCSVSDLFADWTKPEWRYKIIKTIEQCPQHTFQLLTKQPQNIYEFDKPENIWLGVTITNRLEVKGIDYLRHRTNARIKFVSFEPLLDKIYCDLKGVDWIIIGKLTGSKRVQLQKQWVDVLVEQAREKNISIFIKNNVKWHEKIQEFPEGA